MSDARKPVGEPAPTAEPPKPRTSCSAGVVGCGILFDEHAHAKPEPPAPSPDLDPLEEPLQRGEETARRYGDRTMLGYTAALRVLKRGHWKELSGGVYICSCGDELPWPCPLLAEAARALRGETK